jgi:hypothetical protein
VEYSRRAIRFMTFLPADSPQFESFVSQAKSLVGSDVSKDWLLEVWSGADGNLNRALNHVLDSPDHKIKREGKTTAKSDDFHADWDSMSVENGRVVQMPQSSILRGPTSTQPPKPSQHNQPPQTTYQPSMAGAPSVYSPPYQSSQQFPAHSFQPPAFQQMPSQMFIPQSSNNLGYQNAANQLSNYFQSQLFSMRNQIDMILSNPMSLQLPETMEQYERSLKQQIDNVPGLFISFQGVRDFIKKEKKEASRARKDIEDKIQSDNPMIVSQMKNQLEIVRRREDRVKEVEKDLEEAVNGGDWRDIKTLALEIGVGKKKRDTRTNSPTDGSETEGSEHEYDAAWWERKQKKKQEEYEKEEKAKVIPNSNPFLNRQQQQQQQQSTPQTSSLLLSGRLNTSTNQQQQPNYSSKF